jgi:hypothetical protein
MPRDPIESFVDAYAEAISSQNAAIFAGAGLSIPAGMVNWKDLLRDIAKEIGLDVDKEDDLISVAQYHVNEHRSRHRINQALLNEFSKRAKQTDNHTILASLPIRTYWTTNYDSLLEEALRAAGKTPDVKLSVENLATTLRRRDAIIYKMHGDASMPDQAVLTKDDYEAYSSTRQLFSTALQGDLVSKTFLFIGFSFTDPNLGYILSRIRLLLHENRRDHYCLLRRVQRKDFAKKALFDYARTKQDLQVNDLKRYGINGLLVDTYAEFTEVLREVSRLYHRSRIFLSGSAADYGTWSEDKAQALMSELSGTLIREGFGIVTGFGVGVGPYVVNGALAQLEKESTRLVDDRLVMRPFPLGIVDAAERRRRWTSYRKDMLAQAGIAMFLFGNRPADSGAIVNADGMEEEFELAVSQGIRVIPLGCTGAAAAVLHRRVLDNFAKYYPARGYKSAFEELGHAGTARQIVERVLALAKRLPGDRR